ncbi:MAG: DUF4261 domain-containing protein [Planctomycetes bacterium]|nr:DUF4261 domain-containing protein [Planctomycetota bacterium]
MSEPLTRVTLFVPGAPSSEEAWGAALERRGVRLEGGELRCEGQEVTAQGEWVENDGAFGAAFSFGTVSPRVVEELAGCPGALVLRWPVDLREGREAIVAVVERLRDAGAIAVRLEQSKVGWEAARWLELFSSDDPWQWHRGAVAFLSDDGALQSCGMHAFSLPDVRVALDGEDAGALQELASVLDVYQLAEDPPLRSGQTFSPDAGAPRRVVERWPDAGYPEGHPCHNEYGVWRLGPPGGRARRLGDVVLVFMPTLRVTLEALEAEQGTPLTREQVEAARDRSPCIAMEPRDAQRVERARGYSDLDPDLAWEQWRLVRRRGT